MVSKRYKTRRNLIVSLSVMLLILSVAINIDPLFEDSELKLEYNYINIKDIAKTSVANKNSTTSSLNNFLAVVTSNDETEETPTETALPLVQNTVATTQAVTWRLPTEVGYVTQNPSYGHVALDISSSRGSSENIFPIANGVVSGIYTDPAGALVVTVYHNINGQDYTSQYAHLFRYASGLYVGKPVTVNDSLGLMGTTGNSTGVHLHIALVDCHLFDPNDTKCPDLNSFFRYAKTRYNQGFIGLWAVMNVPGSWTSR